MGIILKLFKKTNDEEEKSNISEIKEIKTIKIHICGYGERKKKVIDLLFKSKITKSELKTKGDTEYKSSDFYWITKIYDDEIVTTEKCNEIEDIIEADKTDEKNPLNFHIMLLFGDDNDITDILEEFSLINRPRIVFVTNKIKKIEESNNKKYVTNIICEGMNDRELNSYIVSTLWELDCYYNEKGNEIFRHTPVNIAKGLKSDMSFFSINILLTGMCRAGKSSFINLISGKLMALESNDTESVTLKVSEYYVYKDDDNKENGGIKLIDTPGICDKDEVNSKTLEAINNFITNKNKNIEKQIHLILFFFLEQSTLGHSENLLKILNDSIYPVFFIINKSQDKTWKGKSQDIKSKINFLKKRGCERLAKEDNFIQVNIKSNSGLIYGVDEIFKKFEKYIYDNNLLNKDLFNEIIDIQKNFRHTQYNNIFSKDYNKDTGVKKTINELYEKLKNNLLFKNINIENIKAHGRKIAKKYEKNIILLSNLKNVFPETLNNIPIISFLQAFMIKEIGAGYGFDFNSVNYCFKKFDKDINNLKLDDIKEEKSSKKELMNIYKNEDIENQKDELNSTINEIWNNSNQEVIEKLVKRIHELTLLKGKNKIADENAFNIENTKAISKICQIYFEKELDSSYGLPFLDYNFKKNESLMKDIKYYTEKKDWEKDEMEIKEKKAELFGIL